MPTILLAREGGRAVEATRAAARRGDRVELEGVVPTDYTVMTTLSRILRPIASGVKDSAYSPLLSSSPSADCPAALRIKQARAAKVQQQVGRLPGRELYPRIHSGDKFLVAGRQME